MVMLMIMMTRMITSSFPLRSLGYKDNPHNYDDNDDTTSVMMLTVATIRERRR